MKIEIGNEMLRSVRLRPLICLAMLSFILSLVRPAIGAELITNGSFETGNFTGWTVTNAAGSWFNWQVGTAGGGGGFTPPIPLAPVHGTFVAWNGVAANAGGSYIMYQQIVIPAGTSQLRWRHRFQQDLATFCSGATCGTNTYRVEITNTSNVVLQTLYVSTANPGTIHNTGWQVNWANLSAYAGQTIRIRFRTTVTVTLDGPGQLEVDGVSVQAPALYTASNVSVGGRAITSFGQGISRSVVTLTAANGTVRTAITNPFGIYRFDEVPVGESYVISITDKRYLFGDPTRVVTVTDDLSDVDFTALF